MKSKKVRTLVPNCDDYNISRKCYLKNPRPGLQRIRTVCERYYDTTGWGKTYTIRKSEKTEKPDGHIVMYRTQVWDMPSKDTVAELGLVYKLIFQIHQNLRLNITLTQVHLYAFVTRALCWRQKTQYINR